MLLSLPLPLCAALVLIYIAASLLQRDQRATALFWLVILHAGQAALIAAVQHYGIAALRPVQPITALSIAPVAWLAYIVTVKRGLKARDGAHLAWPVLGVCLLFSLPDFLDVLVPLSFFGYAALLMFDLRNGVEDLPRARIGAGSAPAGIWRIIALSLALSGLSDVLIVSAQIAGQGHLQPVIISVASAGLTLLVGVMSLSRDISPPVAPQQNESKPEITSDMAALFTRLEQMMDEKKLYLDPDLTLSQMARKLGVPVKQLSTAINLASGGNVSRYVNGKRIETACTELAAGSNVTQAMLSSGFLTKSNFNREFKRVTGAVPSQWVAPKGA